MIRRRNELWDLSDSPDWTRAMTRGGALPMNTVVVQGGVAEFAQDIAVGRHRLTADEPESAGGGDSGPSPYDLLLAALGS